MRPGGLAIAVIDESGVVQSFAIQDDADGRFMDVDVCGQNIRDHMSPADARMFLEHLQYTLRTGREMENCHVVHLTDTPDYRHARIRRISETRARVSLSCELPAKKGD